QFRAPADAIDPSLRLRVLRVQREDAPECRQRRARPVARQIFFAAGEAPRNQRRADATRLLLGIADESGDHLERLLDSRLREKRLELRAQLRGGLVAPRRIALEATRDDLGLAVAHRQTHRARV